MPDLRHQERDTQLATLEASTSRIEFELDGVWRKMFACMLMERNAGRSPADQAYVTPGQLAQSLVCAILLDDAQAEADCSPAH